jgi:hypothetical protein
VGEEEAGVDPAGGIAVWGEVVEGGADGCWVDWDSCFECGGRVFVVGDMVEGHDDWRCMWAVVVAIGFVDEEGFFELEGWGREA